MASETGKVQRGRPRPRMPENPYARASFPQCSFVYFVVVKQCNPVVPKVTRPVA